MYQPFQIIHLIETVPLTNSASAEILTTLNYKFSVTIDILNELVLSPTIGHKLRYLKTIGKEEWSKDFKNIKKAKE